MAETKQAKSKKSRSKKTSSGSSSKSKAKSSNGTGSDSVTDSVKNGAKSVTNGVAPVVEKAKVPLLAGGAAVVGIAGTVLAARSGRKRKVLGVTVPKRSKLSLPKRNGFKPDARKVSHAVTDAARRADQFGQGVSRIASSMQKVGETAEKATKKG